MHALIRTRKARKTEDGWEHPVTGMKIGTEKEVFCIDAENGETGEPIIGFVVDRFTLEQVMEGMDKALTIDPVSIRLA